MSEWISVKERLPEIGEQISFIATSKKVIQNQNGHVWFSHNENQWVENGACSQWYPIREQVTHWMPLPEPPKEIDA
jgi:hypothetical protein